MSLVIRIKKWLNTKPSEDDLFFVNIRETYQSLQVIFTDKQLVSFFCYAIYVTSLLLLVIDFFSSEKLSNLSIVFVCISLLITILRSKGKEISFL